MEEAETPIKSIELQLVRVESITHNDSTGKEGTALLVNEGLMLQGQQDCAPASAAPTPQSNGFGMTACLPLLCLIHSHGNPEHPDRRGRRLPQPAHPHAHGLPQALHVCHHDHQPYVLTGSTQAPCVLQVVLMCWPPCLRAAQASAWSSR